MSEKFRGWFRRPLLLLVALFSGLIHVGDAAGQEESAPARLVKVDGPSVGLLLDDADPKSLLCALRRSRQFLQDRPSQDRQVFFPPSVLRQTLEELEELVRQNLSGRELTREIQRRFDLFTVQRSGEERRMLITGYYEPEFSGSLHRRVPYLAPLFGVPDDLVLSTGRPRNQRVWRRQENLLYSYWRRKDIEGGSLPAESALAYLADPVEAFLLHVQGSGRIKLEDGTVKKIHYAANNGLTYRSIGKLLVERGVMQLEDVNMPSILAYLREHPEERQEILNHNDRYIFFAWEEGESTDRFDGPVGSMGKALTAGRSVAVDSHYYPPGMVGFLRTRQPRFDRKGRLFSWVSMNRFVFAQDTGGAIKGPGRLDVFYGKGPFAERAAGVMRQEGTLFILVKKAEEAGVLEATSHMSMKVGEKGS